MEQKSYKLEIILELLKCSCHARGIAKKFDTNHMNISRKLKELLGENVVDYKEEGRNKTYFFKKTLEAKTHIFMAENYKLTRVLKKYPNLRTVTEKIQKNKEIKLALLFGSYAKGLSKSKSDIDIYIETNKRRIKEDLEISNTKLSIKIGKFDLDSLLIKEIIKNHIILKGIEEFYEKIKFFN